MKKIKSWISNHQAASFFILAYLIAWPGFFLAMYIYAGNQIVEVFTSWVVFGPAPGAMIVSAVSSQEVPGHCLGGTFLPFRPGICLLDINHRI